MLIKLWKSLTYCLAYVIGLIFGSLGLVIPRDHKRWLVGSWYGNRFADNGKWFFLKSVGNSDVSIIFSTRSLEVYNKLRERGYPVVRANTFRGLWNALRAGVYLYDSYPIDANFWAINRALWVQMWHGIPLKRIERDIADTEHPVAKSLRRADQRSFSAFGWTLLRWPWRLKKEDLACCTSETLVPIFAKAFGIPQSRMRITGYPRNDIICASTDGSNLKAFDGEDLFAARAPGQRILLYAPTFRDDAVNKNATQHTWSEEQQLALHALLTKFGAVLFVKLHPHIASGWKIASTATSIRFLPSELDLYTILGQVDVLITDYSSIYFDYLLLERPVIFYCYDLEQYAGSRGFYFDYESITPGPKAHTFAELTTAIEQALEKKVDYSDEIRRVKTMFHKFSDGDSTARVGAEVQKELELRGRA